MMLNKKTLIHFHDNPDLHKGYNRSNGPHVDHNTVRSDIPGILLLNPRAIFT
jgi:hypothetical protein